jgi:hypothetical protein
VNRNQQQKMFKHIPLKLTYVGTDEIRRFKISSTTKFDEFLQQVQKNYPSNNPPKLSLSYLDEDGDWITMSTQSEWESMISSFHSDLLRIRAIPCEKKNDSKKESNIEEMFGCALQQVLNHPEKISSLFAPMWKQYNGCGHGHRKPSRNYDSEIQTLASMGFYDKMKNLELLHRFHGNVNRVVQHLVEE